MEVGDYEVHLKYYSWKLWHIAMKDALCAALSAVEAKDYQAIHLETFRLLEYLTLYDDIFRMINTEEEGDIDAENFVGEDCLLIYPGPRKNLLRNYGNLNSGQADSHRRVEILNMREYAELTAPFSDLTWILTRFSYQSRALHFAVEQLRAEEHERISSKRNPAISNAFLQKYCVSFDNAFYAAVVQRAEIFANTVNRKLVSSADRTSRWTASLQQCVTRILPHSS